MKTHPPTAGGSMDQDLIGRKVELDRILRFLDAVAAGPGAFMIQGAPGIGKTTLWMAGCSAAERRGFRVRATRATQADAKLSFAALGDLLADDVERLLPRLPPPQRRAVAVACLLEESAERAPSPRAVALGTLASFRIISQESPLIIAIDDVQWLDAPSASVLRFVARRLGELRVGFLCTVRVEDEASDPLGLADALVPERVRRVSLDPLGVDELGSLLRARLAELPTRSTVLKMHAASGGNPFYAIEFARAALDRRSGMAAGDVLAIPRTLHDLVSDRLTGLPAAARAVVLAVSALSRPTTLQLDAAIGPQFSTGLDQAVHAGVVDEAAGRVRFTHPLLASVIYADAPAEERRALHRRLASVLDDPEERARHLALGSRRPSQRVASSLDEAASLALARGAPEAAAELSEFAARLTPRGATHDLVRRMSDAADAHLMAGEPKGAMSLLEDAAALADPGPERAQVLSQLGTTRAVLESWVHAIPTFERGLVDASGEPRLTASLHLGLAYARLFSGDVATAERHAAGGLRAAEELGDRVLIAEASQALGFLRFALGRGIREPLMRRAIALERELEPDPDLRIRGNVQPRFAYAQMLKYAGSFDLSRQLFESLLQSATEHGEEFSLPTLHYHLAELECWTGNWHEATSHATASLAAAVQAGMDFYRTMALYATGLVAAHRGRVQEAQDAAEEGLFLSERSHAVMSVILNRSVLGFLALSEGNAGRAVESLRSAAELQKAAGFGDPNLFTCVPDLVEALVAVGGSEEARSYLEPYEKAGRRLHRSWALAAAARCRGILSAAGGDVEGAAESFERALAFHDRDGRPFERARTLLMYGQILRRDRKWGRSRAALDDALAAFRTLGAPLWADRARAELRRIGGRAPAPLGLTPTEERVAEFASMGRTNREIADALFISVRTVEWNLTRVFRKLGVRSRTELAQRLRSGEQPSSA